MRWPGATKFISAGRTCFISKKLSGTEVSSEELQGSSLMYQEFFEFILCTMLFWQPRTQWWTTQTRRCTSGLRSAQDFNNCLASTLQVLLQVSLDSFFLGESWNSHFINNSCLDSNEQQCWGVKPLALQEGWYIYAMSRRPDLMTWMILSNLWWLFLIINLTISEIK